MNDNENWQWCDVCYGQTIWENDKCSQCGNTVRAFIVSSGNVQYITVADRQTLQIRSEYTINNN